MVDHEDEAGRAPATLLDDRKRLIGREQQWG
jgi:hypothetical protein